MVDRIQPQKQGQTSRRTFGARINCASCHVAQITVSSGGDPIRVLGTTSDFNVEAFFGPVLVATIQTTDPANMKMFLAAYLGAEPAAFEAAWSRQAEKIPLCHPDPPQDGEGPRNCSLRFLTLRQRGLHLRGPSPRCAGSG